MSSLPRILFITGGTAARPLARHLAAKKIPAGYLIGTADNGRSSGELRRVFDPLPAFGDIRSRENDLAGDSPECQAASRILSHRTNVTVFEAFADLCKKTENDIVSETMFLKRQIIEIALQRFDKERKEKEQSSTSKFDFTNASIGNLVLCGMYFAFNRHLPTALFCYSLLLGAKGKVFPATTDCLHLAARMVGGSNLYGQSQITKSSLGPVQELWFVDRAAEGAEKITPSANKKALLAIREAELLVFSMGSFWTSILSVLHIPEIAKAIIESNAKKVFVANAYEDAETTGMTVAAMADTLIGILKRHGENVSDDRCLNAVVANTLMPPDSKRTSHTLDSNIIERDHPGIRIIGKELRKEDEPEKLETTLFSFLGNMVR